MGQAAQFLKDAGLYFPVRVDNSLSGLNYLQIQGCNCRHFISFMSNSEEFHWPCLLRKAHMRVLSVIGIGASSTGSDRRW